MRLRYSERGGSHVRCACQCTSRWFALYLLMMWCWLVLGKAAEVVATMKVLEESSIETNIIQSIGTTCLYHVVAVHINTEALGSSHSR